MILISSYTTIKLDQICPRYRNFTQQYLFPDYSVKKRRLPYLINPTHVGVTWLCPGGKYCLIHNLEHQANYAIYISKIKDLVQE